MAETDCSDLVNECEILLKKKKKSALGSELSETKNRLAALEAIRLDPKRDLGSLDDSSIELAWATGSKKSSALRPRSQYLEDKKGATYGEKRSATRDSMDPPGERS